MNSAEKQINTLLRWMNVEIKPSNIHGVGVFAIKDIPKGTKMFMDIMPFPFQIPYKKLQNNVPAYIHDQLVGRWPRIKLGEIFIYPDARYVAFCNHSDEPNYDPIKDVTLRDVKLGEEITEDYRKIPNHRDIYSFLKE